MNIKKTSNSTLQIKNNTSEKTIPLVQKINDPKPEMLKVNDTMYIESIADAFNSSFLDFSWNLVKNQIAIESLNLASVTWIEKNDIKDAFISDHGNEMIVTLKNGTTYYLEKSNNKMNLKGLKDKDGKTIFKEEGIIKELENRLLKINKSGDRVGSIENIRISNDDLCVTVNNVTYGLDLRTMQFEWINNTIAQEYVIPSDIINQFASNWATSVGNNKTTAYELIEKYNLKPENIIHIDYNPYSESISMCLNNGNFL